MSVKYFETVSQASGMVSGCKKVLLHLSPNIFRWRSLADEPYLWWEWKHRLLERKPRVYCCHSWCDFL